MAKRPTFTSSLRESIVKLDRSEVAALSRLPTLETDDDEFGKIFAKNPGVALAAKGLEVSDAEVARIKDQIKDMAGPGRGGGNPLATEVEVSVKVKF